MPRLARSDDLAAALRLAYDTARAELGFALPLEAFVNDARVRLERRLARSGGRTDAAALRAALASIAPRDLYLAAACAAGVGAAWDRLFAGSSPRMLAALRARGACDAVAEEIVAELPGLLLVRAGHGEDPLTSYSASGSLVSWLVVVALRTLSRRRAAQRRDTRAQRAVLEAALALPPAPVDVAVAAEERSGTERLMHAVLAELAPRQRIALALRFSAGLPLNRIAATLGIGVPRASRIVASAVACVRARLRERDLEWSVLRDALTMELAREP